MMPPGSDTAPRRLANVDALRGLAALAVCLFHWEHIGFGTPVNEQFFRFGLLGVELFFMISGFVIGLVAERSPSVPRFVLARVVRLYPAYLASVALTALYVLPVGKYGVDAVLVNVTMLQSFVDVPNITNPYWTLAFEIVFYGLVTGLLAARALARMEFFALAWLALALLYRLTIPGPLGFDAARPLAQLGYIVVAPQFAPFFVLGAMVHRLQRVCLGTPGRIAVTAALGLTLFGRADFAQVSGPAYATAAVVMTVTLRIAARGAAGDGSVMRTLGRLGIVSYPLYLVHCTVANLCVSVLSPYGIGPALAVVVSVPLSLLLAVCLQRRLERPIITAFHNARRRRSDAASVLGPSYL